MSPSPDEEAIARLFEQLPRLAADDADLIRRGRFLDCDFEIGVGTLPLMVSMRAGRVERVTRGPFLLKPTVFAIAAAPETWRLFLEALPKAGWHDIMALSKTGKARISGNLQPYMANLQVIKDVLALPRQLAAEAKR